MRQLISKEVNHFYPISEDGHKYLKEKHGIDEMRITLARLGTRNLGVALPGSRKTLRIISCSNVISVKRVHLIIDALAQIDDIPIIWEHFGTGELLSQLKAYADLKLMKMSNLQYMWKGFVPNSDFLAYCIDNPAHLFVNVSESEGVPVSIMEALSLATPVVATAVGGTPEVVSHGENGLLLSENVAPDEISSAFRQFREMSDDEYGRYRTNARKTWLEMCDAAQLYPAFYESLITL